MSRDRTGRCGRRWSEGRWCKWKRDREEVFCGKCGNMWDTCAWMTNLFRGNNACNSALLSHACSRSEWLYWCTAFCDALYAHKCVVRVGSVYTHRRLSGSLSPGQPKVVLSEKNLTNDQTVKNARNSNFLWSNGCFPNSWTRTMATKAIGFPALVYRTSSLFDGRPHCRILQFLRTVVLFFVSLAGFEEWFYIPAGSLPYIRRVMYCILFSLEQSRVVESTVAEDHPDSIWESNVLSDEFSQLLSQPSTSLSHLARMNECCPCFFWPALCSISLALLNVLCRSEGPCLAPRLLFFLIK